MKRMLTPDEVKESERTGVWFAVMLVAAILLAFLCSCEINQYESKSASGNSVKETHLQLGGTRSNSRADGSSNANSYENSVRDVANAMGSYVGFKYGFKARDSDNALSGLKTKEAAGVTKNAADNATKVKLGSQVPILTEPPTQVTFPPP